MKDIQFIIFLLASIYLLLKNCEREIEELKKQKMSSYSETNVISTDDKIQELELLLDAKNRKIQFLEDEHKNEVVRASEAEDEAASCR